jgi:hypothetical protein
MFTVQASRENGGYKKAIFQRAEVAIQPWGNLGRLCGRDVVLGPLARASVRLLLEVATSTRARACAHARASARARAHAHTRTHARTHARANVVGMGTRAGTVVLRRRYIGM